MGCKWDVKEERREGWRGVERGGERGEGGRKKAQGRGFRKCVCALICDYYENTGVEAWVCG
jgi:hypothetical protein